MAKDDRYGKTRGGFDRNWEQSRDQPYRSESFPREGRYESDYERDFGRSEAERGGYGSGGEFPRSRGYLREDFERGSEWTGGYGTGRGWEGESSGWGTTGGVGGTQPWSRGRGMRGRGPKGFRRSDERIRELVSEALEDDDYIDASNIEVKVQNGEVTLTGSVEDRYEKRRAEDLIENVSGVRNVQNQLRLTRAGEGEIRTGTSRGETRPRSRR